MVFDFKLEMHARKVKALPQDLASLLVAFEFRDEALLAK